LNMSVSENDVVHESGSENVSVCVVAVNVIVDDVSYVCQNDDHALMTKMKMMKMKMSSTMTMMTHGKCVYHRDDVCGGDRHGDDVMGSVCAALEVKLSVSENWCRCRHLDRMSSESKTEKEKRLCCEV
jgi:hypothetical protein